METRDVYPSWEFNPIGTLIWGKKTFFLLENKKERKNIHFSFRREKLLRTHYR